MIFKTAALTSITINRFFISSSVQALKADCVKIYKHFGKNY